jgi:tetratricopeptide (TPR) repeat protein
MRAALETRDLLQRYYWGFRTSAEIEMLVGGTFTDEDEPRQAERELERAVEHLEEFERTLVGRGFGEDAVRGIRNLRASALVSLAVNANVKLKESERARAYFERAYALKQDDFMKVLLACYRARSGHAYEARALVREITPGPGSYYNLACTHALLGDTERALELLRRELEESRLSPGALEKQREWARQDPDLESLRGDPRFEELVGP